MIAPPRDQSRHVVARDFGQQLVLAEKLNQQRESMLAVTRPSVVLSDLVPVAIRHVIQAQRSPGRRQLRDQSRCLLALGLLYFFGFSARRACRLAVTPMTSRLEVEVKI